MRKQLEILIYQFKKRRNIDVYSALTPILREQLVSDIEDAIYKIEYRTYKLYEERIMPNERNV